MNNTLIQYFNGKNFSDGELFHKVVWLEKYTY